MSQVVRMLLFAMGGGLLIAVATTSTVAAEEASPSPAATVTATHGDAVAGWVLLFGAAALVLLYLYLHAWRRSWDLMAARTLERTGQLPDVHDVRGEISVPQVGAQGVQDERLAVRGPGHVVVGRPSEPFTATIDDQPTTAVQWGIDGIRGTVDPTSGHHTQVTAEEAKPFSVIATIKGTEVRVYTTATAEEPAPSSRGTRSVGRLPVAGSGYGALTIGILAVTVAGALTAIGVLPGAALATLLGTVVSYFFVQAATDRAGGRSPETSDTGG